MKIGIVFGSHRLQSQTGKVARHIEQSLLDQGIREETYLLNLAGNPLPLWDESIWEGMRCGGNS